MSCSVSAPNTFLVPPGGAQGCFAFPPKTAWVDAAYTFDLSQWLAPAGGLPPVLTTEFGFPLLTEGGVPLTTAPGPDSILLANASVTPGDLVISRMAIGASTITVYLRDGAPYTDHVLSCMVMTQQGQRTIFTANLWVEGGPPLVSPYLATEFGYPLETETGNLIYWPQGAPITWSYPYGSQVVTYENGAPVLNGDGQVIFQ